MQTYCMCVSKPLTGIFSFVVFVESVSVMFRCYCLFTVEHQKNTWSKPDIVCDYSVTAVSR